MSDHGDVAAIRVERSQRRGSYDGAGRSPRRSSRKPAASSSATIGSAACSTVSRLVPSSLAILPRRRRPCVGRRAPRASRPSRCRGRPRSRGPQRDDIQSAVSRSDANLERRTAPAPPHSPSCRTARCSSTASGASETRSARSSPSERIAESTSPARKTRRICPPAGRSRSPGIRRRASSSRRAAAQDHGAGRRFPRSRAGRSTRASGRELPRRLGVAARVVAVPVARVRERVVRAVVEQPRVAAALRRPTRAAARTSPRRARATQLTSIVANPPSSRCVRERAHDVARDAVASRPLSRKRNADSGEITYGGLRGDEPKRSPATGSKKLPARSSTFSTPLSAALNAAKLERALVQVGRDDVRRCGATARIAWMPEPGADVERRLDRPADGEVRERQRRAVDAGDVVGPLGVRVEPAVGRDQDLVVRARCGRARRTSLPSALDEPELLERAERQRRAPARSASGDRRARARTA